mgnify:CR=1 FL=1
MRTVKYIRANYLLQESAHAHSEDNYYEYSNKMAGYDLLVIDDFGLMDLNLDKCRDLFEIIEARDCRKSTVIISQMPVVNWYQLFGDNTYADEYYGSNVPLFRRNGYRQSGAMIP